ncbi:MAG TPA: glycosyltransferase family 2 protein [Candidatus Methylomirabilis sp.]|nr:glycosyltransferase family 2 protein [Candidatus Methylomirabilis sp.]
MSSPLISVIIPCHNSKPEELEAAIRSMLCQTYPNLEILVIDDHSENNLLEIVHPFLLKHPNIRFAQVPDDDPDRTFPNGVNINAGWQARNYGMSLARGELITFQDDDDGSCSNRLEFQYEMMKKFNVLHVNVDWQQYRDEYNCRRLDYRISDQDIVTTKEILALARQTRPKLFRHPFGKNEKNNRAEKIFRKINRKYFTDWRQYPCAASMPLFSKEVLTKCRFRQLYERTRPSKTGRGADRDFNFWVAETFKSSIAIKIPLILWRVKNQNLLYSEEKYRPGI